MHSQWHFGTKSKAFLALFSDKYVFLREGWVCLRTEGEIKETHKEDSKDIQHNTVTHAVLFRFGCRNCQMCHLKVPTLSSFLCCRVELVMTSPWFLLAAALQSYCLILHHCIIFLRLTFPFFPFNLKTVLLSQVFLTQVSPSSHKLAITYFSFIFICFRSSWDVVHYYFSQSHWCVTKKIPTRWLKLFINFPQEKTSGSFIEPSC